MIPARHGVATFVPAGQTIKVVNTSGTQVIDTWAFALPKPDEKNAPAPGDGEGVQQDQKQGQKQDQKQGQQQDQKQEPKEEEKAAPQQKTGPKKGKRASELPSQEDAEKATQEGMQKAEDSGDQAKAQTPQKSSWSSYVPSLGLTSSKKSAGSEAPKQDVTEQQKNSRTWSSYIPSGKGFSSYVPKSATDTVTALAQDVSVVTLSATQGGANRVSTNETRVNPTSSNYKTFPRRPSELPVSKVTSLCARLSH